MKKIFFFAFLFVLCFGIVSSAEIELKEEFVKGETLIAKISGNFVKQPIKDNMNFYRRHMSTSMGFYDVVKIEGDYYIYVNIPLEKEADNYSLEITGVEYYSGTKVIDDDLVANFTISDSQASFSISPVLFVAENDYILELRNLVSTKIEIVYEKLTEEEANEIAEEQDKPSFFESLFGTPEKTDNESIIEEIVDGETVILKSGEVVEVTIPIGNYVGFEKVKFVYGNESYNSMIYIEGKEVVEPVEEEEEPREEENESVEENVTIIEEENETEEEPRVEPCSELNGTICEKDYECEGEIGYSSTAICCLGECVKVEKSNTGKTVGWVIIIFLALFLTWFFKNKYRRAKPKPVDLEKVSQGKK